MTFSVGIKNNIRASFAMQMLHGRAISNNPYIHLCRFSISGGTGDPALGTEGTQVNESNYFVEADMDMPKVTETALKFETSIGGSAQTMFYIPSMPVYYTDTIEHGPEMRINAHLYNNILMCDTARFQSNGIKIGDTIKIFNKPITGGVYSLEYTDLVKTIDSETQVTLSAGIGITGVTRAYSVRTSIYDITAILPDDEYNYVVINTERQI
jgi:hypothetical protein